MIHLFQLVMKIISRFSKHIEVSWDYFNLIVFWKIIKSYRWKLFWTYAHKDWFYKNEVVHIWFRWKNYIYIDWVYKWTIKKPEQHGWIFIDRIASVKENYM